MHSLKSNRNPLTSILLFITGVIILGGCHNKKQAAPAVPKQLSLAFDEQVTIPTNTAAERLVSPSTIQTNGKGDMYIADADLHKIEVFDRTGLYQRSIGGPGKGPGEFINVQAIDINRQNELLTFDGSNRRVTRFSASGNILSTYVSLKGLLWPHDVRQLDGNRYLLLSKKGKLTATDDEGQSDPATTFLHVYDCTFEHHISSFGAMDSLTGLKNNFVRLYSNANPGVVCVTKNDAVWYAPAIYDGQLYKFKKGPAGWTLDQTLKGKVIPHEAVDLDNDAEGAMYFSRYTNTGTVTYSAKIQSESMGLFVLRDGRLVHLSSQLKGEKRVMLVEVFSKQGKLAGTGQLKSFTFDGASSSIPVGAVWKDQKDRFYFINNRDIPVVRVGRIKGI